MRTLINLQPGGPAFGLALDEALLALSEERSTLRLWRNTLSVIIGRSQHLHDEVDWDRCRETGIPVYRRCSGGGTVLHYPGNLNITLIVNGLWREKTVHEVDAACGCAIANAVESVGITCRRVRNALLDSEGSRKLSGSAQAVRGERRLYHATLLLAAPPVPMSSILRAMRPGYAPSGLPSQPRHVVSMNELLAAQSTTPPWLRSGIEFEPGLQRLVGELVTNFRVLLEPQQTAGPTTMGPAPLGLDASVRSGTITPEERTWARHLEQSKYSTSAWTHRH